MIRRSTMRAMLGLVLAVSSLSVIAAPAGAAIVIEGCSGTCGYWEVKDTGPAGPKGAVCGYETASYDLDFISVRPPLMHGNYSYKTKVEWCFKVRRATSSGGSYSTIHTSTWQGAVANSATPAYAGNGFSRRWWYAPESPIGFFDIWTERSPTTNGSSASGTATRTSTRRSASRIGEHTR